MDSRYKRAGGKMAYTVEMIWGKSQYTVIMGLDADGELCPKTVIGPEGEPDPERRYYRYGGAQWKRALDLGIQHGWRPMGTVPSESSRSAWEEFGRFENDYQPSDWQYCKQFLAEDAANLADALQRAMADEPELQLENFIAFL